MDRAQQLAATLHGLRREFDDTFARAPSGDSGAAQHMLAVRVGPEPFAIPVAQIQGLYADRRVVPLPTLVPELLGVASFRGRVVPVYDLAALLLGTRSRTTPRWLVLVRGGAALGLAFDAFEGQLSLRCESAGAESVCLDGVVRPVVHLPSIARQIQSQADSVRRVREKRR